MRSVRIDVQTDSTIALQEGDDAQGFAEALSAMGSLISEVFPLVQQQIIPFEAAKGLAQTAVRKFRMGYELETVITAMKQPPPPNPESDPKILAIKAQAQADAATEQARVQADAQISQAQAATDAKLAAFKADSDQKTQMLKGALDGIVSLIETHLNIAGKIEVQRVATLGDQGTSLLDSSLQAAHEEENHVRAQAGIQQNHMNTLQQTGVAQAHDQQAQAIDQQNAQANAAQQAALQSQQTTQQAGLQSAQSAQDANQQSALAAQQTAAAQQAKSNGAP
jgi:hypothetical protein